jgi:hypothetical protein
VKFPGPPDDIYSNFREISGHEKRYVYRRTQMVFAGIGMGPNVNMAAMSYAVAAGASEDVKEKKKKDAVEAKRQSTGSIKNEHKHEASQIAFEEFTKAQVLKGQGPAK